MTSGIPSSYGYSAALPGITPSREWPPGRRCFTTICHLGNLSHRLAWKVKIDPKSETLGSDTEANGWLKKRYRPEHPLPRV